jgi:hypothetical protein
MDRTGKAKGGDNDNYVFDINNFFYLFTFYS